MLSWQVDGLADVDRVLAALDDGHAVMVELGPLHGRRLERERKAHLLDELARLAGIRGADVREFDRTRIRRFRRGTALRRCLISPRPRGSGPEDAGVREPRRPLPGSGSLAAAVEQPGESN